MRIYIRCTVDGCGAEFGGDERAVLSQYSVHMEGHQLKVRQDNEKTMKRREAELTNAKRNKISVQSA